MQEAAPGSGDKEGAGLRIAWQYRRYIEDQKSAPTK